jgi:copper chaperone
MQKVVLSVEGMSCSHCENRVKKALSELPGVSEVTVSLAEKIVSVAFDPAAVTEQTLKETIEDQGYDVT